MIDLFTVIECRGIDVSDVRESFESGNTIGLYDRYQDVIQYLLFIDTEEDYADFLGQSKLNEESFLLALAYLKGLCNAFSANEVDETTIVERYNGTNANSERKYVVLDDYHYDDGSFYVFEVSQEEYDDEWCLNTVNRIV